MARSVAAGRGPEKYSGIVPLMCFGLQLCSHPGHGINISARLASSGEIDRSAIDYAGAATALSRGYSIADVMMELNKVSLKAATLSRSARESYVRRTVQAARE